tara:strand:- start:13 stop:243 length:231 start_codon:yes stop_codon:yes gene_type:complete
MKYYRLIFRKQEDTVFFSEIQEHEIGREEFESMKWDRPIIRQVMGADQHFISLDPTYLDAMVLGIGTYLEMDGSPS